MNDLDVVFGAKAGLKQYCNPMFYIKIKKQRTKNAPFCAPFFLINSLRVDSHLA